MWSIKSADISNSPTLWALRDLSNSFEQKLSQNFKTRPDTKQFATLRVMGNSVLIAAQLSMICNFGHGR